MRYLLKSVRVVDPTSGWNGKTLDVLIANGVIGDIGAKLPEDSTAKIIDGKGKMISPGWVDMGVFTGDPGFEHKEDFDTVVQAAAAGGYTVITSLPNTFPPVDSKSAVEYVLSRTKNKPVRVLPYGALSVGCQGKDLTEIYDMHCAGAVAFTDGIAPEYDAGLVMRAMQYVLPFNGLIISYPVDWHIVKGGVMHEGAVSTRLGLKGMPAVAEEMAIVRNLQLLEYTGSKLHIAFISTQQALLQVRKAKKAGMDVTCGVYAYNLLFDHEYLTGYDTNFKTMPPLREKQDIRALIRGIRNGDIDIIASGHFPQDTESKKCEFDLAKFGMTGLESAFGIIRSVLTKPTDIEIIIEKISINPRKILNLAIPSIEKGNVAEITLFDPDEEWIFTEEHIRSKSANTPLPGMRLKGRVYGIFNHKKTVLEAEKSLL